jgi:CubicO group peptidase (beta-lactamase class C family)
MSLNKLLTSVMLLISTTLAAQNRLDTLSYLKNNPNVYSILIAKNHQLVYQKFYNHYNDTSLFNDQSLTKDICSLLIGIAIDKGYLTSADEKLSAIFPELKNDTDKRKQQVTIRMVMNQASGLYHENLAFLPGFLSLADPSNHVLHAPMVADPGREWHYNNAASHLLSVIITKSTHTDTRAFADKYLFGPLGITHYDWPKMKDGYYDGSGLLAIRLSSLDMLKVGTLILDDGEYQHQQIVPKKWIQSLLNPAIHYNATWGFPASTYAFDFYHFVYKGTPVTYGMGWGGQFLVIIPSLQTVVMINENISDVNAVNQSVAFTHVVFPVVFEEVNE